MPKGRSGIITEEFKGKENTAYHDVEKLFKIYRSVNWKMQIKINQVKRHFQLEYGTDVDKFLDSLYQAGMDVDTDLASEKERVESINHSNNFLKLMDESVDLMRISSTGREILLGALLQLYVGLQSRKCRGNP